MKSIMLGTISVKDLHGPWTDFMEKLQTEDAQEWFSAFKRFLRKENPWVETEKLFEVVRTVPLLASAITSFSAGHHFKVNTASGSPVKIASISSRFGSRFLSWSSGKVEGPTVAQKLEVRRLRMCAKSSEILAKLGGENCVEVTLSTIFRLMKEQGDGSPSGVLLADSWSNIFYAKTGRNDLCLVCVSWSRGGWHVDSFDIDDTNAKFPENSQVFVPTA